MNWLNRESVKRYDIPYRAFAPNQEAMRSSNGEEVITPDEFTYKINNLGFRYDETPKKNTICFIGCSMTFGVGLKESDTFAHIVTANLGEDWQCMNLGVPASGPDIQMLNLTWALNNFKIDKIVWYMSDPLRQFWWNTAPHIIAPAFWPNESEEQEICKQIVSNEQTSYLKTYWNLYSVFSLIKSKNVDTYCTCWTGEFHSIIEPLLTEFNIKQIGNIKWLDKARDRCHPGPLSNKEFATRILEAINES